MRAALGGPPLAERPPPWSQSSPGHPWESPPPGRERPVQPKPSSRASLLRTSHSRSLVSFSSTASSHTSSLSSLVPLSSLCYSYRKPMKLPSRPSSPPFPSSLPSPSPFPLSSPIPLLVSLPLSFSPSSLPPKFYKDKLAFPGCPTPPQAPGQPPLLSPAEPSPSVASSGQAGPLSALRLTFSSDTVGVTGLQSPHDTDREGLRSPAAARRLAAPNRQIS